MYGVLALVVPVNEDIKVIAVFGRYGDKLLVAAEIVYKGRVPVRGKGFFLLGFLVDNAAVVGVVLSLGNEFVKMIFVSFLNSNIYPLKNLLTSRVCISLETPYSKASSHFPIASH